MKFKDEFWAFIPARAGSKELKNKNITKLAGYPLLAYSVKTALKIKKNPPFFKKYSGNSPRVKKNFFFPVYFFPKKKKFFFFLFWL